MSGFAEQYIQKFTLKSSALIFFNNLTLAWVSGRR